MDTLPTVEVSGVRLAYRRTGRGDPLVLLHGAFGDSRDWLPQLEGLADDFDVVAPDLPGCGQSSDPPDGLTPRDYSDILAGFVEALRLGRPHLGGLSFGSVLVLLIYRHHPHLPRSLVLASAYAGWAGSLPQEEFERRERWLREIASLPVEKWAPDFLRTVYPPSTRPEVIARSMSILKDVRPGFFRSAEALLDVDLRDTLPSVAVPALLLYGELDERAPVAVAEDMHARVPGSRLIVLPGVGHGVSEEAPEQFDTAVRQFLQSLPAAHG